MRLVSAVCIAAPRAAPLTTIPIRASQMPPKTSPVASSRKPPPMKM